MKRLWILIIFCTLLLHSAVPFFGNINNANSYSLRKVVIDAGHGGKDPGCIGSGVREKNVALSIALKLGDYIKKKFPEVEVIYTRKTDVFVELHERAAIANRSKADLFISIHCNANNSKQPYGTETYVMGLHKTVDNLEVSKRENAAILYEDDFATQYDGFDPNSPEGHIIFNLFQSAYIEQSVLLASTIQNQFKNRAKRKSRGVFQAGFLVLYKTAMPSVLIETGFLSNWSEGQYLKTDNGQSLIASAIFRAFREYKESLEGDQTDKNLTASREPHDKIVMHKEHQTKSAQKDVIVKPDEKGVNNKPEKKTATIRFKVQILSSTKPVDLSRSKFSGIKDIKQEKNPNGVIKYLVGDYLNIKEAINRQNLLREKGFIGSFIVAYKDELRITVKEALSFKE